MSNQSKMSAVISELQHVKDRPWICCQRPLIIANVKDTDDVVKPLVVLCDKKVDHNGLHRGRGEGKTWIWKGRSERVVQEDRVADLKRTERAQKRQTKTAC